MHDIDTARLRLRPFAAHEAPALHALWTTPDVRRYLWDDRTIPLAETEEIVERSQALFAESRFGLWSIRPGADDRLVGFGGYWYFRDPPELELLLGLAPDEWGRGYATEAGLALIRYGFDQLGFDDVRGSTDAPNQASVRLMARLGMTFERRAVVGGLDTVFYRVTRDSSATMRRRP